MAAIEPPETDPLKRFLRRRPPAATLDWAAAAFGPGGRVVAVRPLASSWLANHALEVADAAGRAHRVVLRRWARPGWDVEDPDFTAAREAAVLELLAPTPVPAPALVAVDPDAAACDVPALLETWLPGDPPDLEADPDRLVEGLAGALPAIHAVEVPRGVPSYRRFYDPDRLSPPEWSARPGLWRRAFAVAAGPPPDDHACLIHRDYHPANTLWSGGRLVGVVDWIGGSWGPPSVDLGHMRVNLAADLGLAAADRFLAAHRALTGFDHHPWWDVASAVDVAPEMDASWRRVEDLVAAALARLGGPNG
jgi:aminoglycoside phosphotransferase (APT) family kinase protein